jgi:molecular chaperone DnaK (HSP70)
MCKETGKDGSDLLGAEMPPKRRRGKREKIVPKTPKRKSRALQKHGQDGPSGGIASLLPSAIGVFILVCGVMAKMGFRGRASVAGIDLGTTNSVICVQAPSKGVGTIDCIPDPATGSPIVPSVVSFLDALGRPVGPSSKTNSLLRPHPSAVVVGQAAKRRIDSHPHQTLYNAKRMLGRDFTDNAVTELRNEVEFGIQAHDESGQATFKVGHWDHAIPPNQVGAYVVNHLIQITKTFLGHENVKSAVICVPAKFDAYQRQLTAEAFKMAGVSVARIVEEPTAAALAYGLHRKAGVDYILVYDFGGGTLDLSLLHVSDGFVDVMGSDGDELLGGADFDATVAHYLLREKDGQAVVDRVADVLTKLEESQGYDLEERLLKACPIIREMPLCTASSFHTIGEQLKIGMSNVTENGSVEAECLALSEDESSEQEWSFSSFCESLIPLTLSLPDSDYNRMIQPLLERSILPLTRLLDDLDLGEDDIQEIVMVGGTSRE